MIACAFLRWPDPRLRQPAEPVGEIRGYILAIWADILDTVEAMPGAKIKRPKAVVVRYLNVQGSIYRKESKYLAAASVQYQIDHLHEKMYFDNLSKLRREMLLRKARKTS